MSTIAGRALSIAGIALLGGAWILYALWNDEPEPPITPATGDRTVVANRVGTENVFVRAGHLNIDVIDRPLRAVLQRIADQTSMTLFVSDEVGDALVSLRAENLVNTDSFVLYGRTKASSQGIVGLWVYAKGEGRDLAPVPVHHSSAATSINGVPVAAAPEERARAVEALVQRRGSAAVPAVLQALKDEDVLVRSRALDAAVNYRLEVPEDVLIHSVQADPAPEVRFIALAGLAALLEPHLTGETRVVNNAEVRAISELALNDPDSEVRWQAQQNLQTLNALDGVLPPTEPEQSQADEQEH
jgi:HEAT repeat protein